MAGHLRRRAMAACRNIALRNGPSPPSDTFHSGNRLTKKTVQARYLT
jgi:hypothetical protein